MSEFWPESTPECPCERCNPPQDLYRRFTMCPTCGYKRCPKGTDHDLDCTGSNDVGQAGSSWEHVGKPDAERDEIVGRLFARILAKNEGEATQADVDEVANEFWGLIERRTGS